MVLNEKRMNDFPTLTCQHFTASQSFQLSPSRIPSFLLLCPLAFLSQLKHLFNASLFPCHQSFPSNLMQEFST